MKNYNTNADTMLGATYAVAMEIGHRFKTREFRSEFARARLQMNYQLLREQDWLAIDRMAERVLERIALGEDTRDLRCEIDVLQGTERTFRDQSGRERQGRDVHVTFRTGIRDYRLDMMADGEIRFGRIAVADEAA